MALTITGRKTIKTINNDVEIIEVPDCTFAPHRIDLTGNRLALREGQIRICSNAITPEGELIEDGIYNCEVSDLDDSVILFRDVTIKDIKDGIGIIAQIIRERADNPVPDSEPSDE
jgi:hypothetical protein